MRAQEMCMATAASARDDLSSEPAYRLYKVRERKKRAAEALSYDGLVQSWPEIMRLACETPAWPGPAQAELLV